MLDFVEGHSKSSHGSIGAGNASAMASELTQTTLSLGERASSSHADVAHAIRWVFPFPVFEPTWLDSARVVFGRDAGADSELPSTQVSRRHAAIARSGPLFLVSDLGSKNGVFVNGRRVAEAALAPGDVVRIGDCVGVFLRAPRGSSLGLETFAPDLFGGYLHRPVVARLRELAPTTLPVVLEGETGTGKERFARALHDWSGRRGPFVAINCAVYSKSIAAAELFGYRKGAFAGAEHASLGHVRAAEGGTLLLDELCELSLDVQAMLLRVIENREVLALGETVPTAIDVRFAATTQESLSAAVSRGRFRPDLRARLEGTAIGLPALRDFRELVPEIFGALFEKHAAVRPEIVARDAEKLCVHDWPLNFRELDTMVRHLAVSYRPGTALDLGVLGSGEPVPPNDASLSPSNAANAPTKGADRSVPGRVTTAPYRPEDLALLIETLARHGGNITRAASELGITRQKAYRMLEAAQGESTDGAREPNGST